MVIQPKVRGFLCTTTHPTGCYENVRRQAEHVRSKGDITDGPKRVLVLGASTGYGLASRITAAFRFWRIDDWRFLRETGYRPKARHRWLVQLSRLPPVGG